MKTAFARLNPFWSGDVVRMLKIRTSGLTRVVNIFDSATGFSLELGALQSSGRIAKVKLPGMNRNQFRRLMRSEKQGVMKFITDLPDRLFIRTGGRIGLKQQANYLVRAYERELIIANPELVETAQRIVERSKGILDGTGLSDREVGWVLKETMARALTDHRAVRTVGEDFTPDIIQE